MLYTHLVTLLLAAAMDACSPATRSSLLPLALMPPEMRAAITLDLKSEKPEELRRAIRQAGFEPRPRP